MLITTRFNVLFYPTAKGFVEFRYTKKNNYKHEALHTIHATHV